MKIEFTKTFIKEYRKLPAGIQKILDLREKHAVYADNSINISNKHLKKSKG
jgi:mRNA-degrading endonuclease RelE of RelBE toxin-antitoxin system